MSACACGESLETPVEQATGTCYLCTFSPPERTPEPVANDEYWRIARKWFRIGVESRGHAGHDDGHIAYADLVAREQRQDAEVDLIRVRCQNCGSHWLLSDVPDGPMLDCEACRV